MYAVIVIALFVGSYVSCLPLIKDPCGASKPVSGTIGTLQSINTGIEDVTEAVKEALHHASILVEKYTTEPQVRVPGGMQVYLNGASIENYPKERRYHEDDSLKVILQGDYDDIALILTFCDIIYVDEITSTRGISFEKEILEMRKILGHLLCKLNMAADTQGFEIFKNIPVVKDEYRDMTNEAQRDIRDYVVFRDARAFLGAMAQDYLEL